MYLQRVKNFLFSEPDTPTGYSIVLLIARIMFGTLFLWHGIAKWTTFYGETENFPDPIGIGSALSFWLAIFAEVACSFGVILGALFRLSLIPMIFTMCVALFVIHGEDPLSVKEPALMYLTIFLLLFISGPGEFSIDKILRQIMG